MNEDVVLLVPNFNGESFINTTIGSLRKYLPYPLLSIDDSSTDKSVDVLRGISNFVIERPVNGGFASAVNTGINFLLDFNCQCIIICNSDVLLNRSIGKKICIEIDDFLASDFSVLGFCEIGSASCQGGEGTSGFFFAIKLNLIRSIGLLDESFFMYGEEQDFFRRTLQAGFKIRQSHIYIQHYKELSSNYSIVNSWYSIRNAIYLEIKSGSILSVISKTLSLFLIINRLRKPLGFEYDPSYSRLTRPSILFGNFLLFKALIWNFRMFFKINRFF